MNDFVRDFEWFMTVLFVFAAIGLIAILAGVVVGIVWLLT